VIDLSKKHASNTLLGYVHSIESLGALDGPGLRSVVFVQGCPLRCKFCHNIDCVPTEGGIPYTISDLVDELLKFKPYWGKDNEKGGVTLSGGEPLYQCRFVYSVAKALHEKNIHIAVDTSLYTTLRCLDLLIPVVNLWMVSIKELDPQKHRKLTGKDNKKILENLRYLDKHLKGKRSIRIRVLIIPTLTNSKEYLENLADIILSLRHLEKVELLAYDDHARFKWLELGMLYPFDGIRKASVPDMQKAAEVLSQKGLPVIY
jgi:pyruvate formate lyase activating enzyme